MWSRLDDRWGVIRGVAQPTITSVKVSRCPAPTQTASNRGIRECQGRRFQSLRRSRRNRVISFFHGMVVISLRWARMSIIHVEVCNHIVIHWSVHAFSLPLALWLSITPGVGADETLRCQGKVSLGVCMSSNSTNGDKCLRGSSVAHLHVRFVVDAEARMIWSPGEIWCLGSRRFSVGPR